VSLLGLDAPEGFRYRNDFVTVDEETALAATIGALEFSTFEMRGVVARRRVLFFGMSYDAGGAPRGPIPEFLMPLRQRIASWAGLPADAFVMALINEYRPGAPIGWHRDAPQYGSVGGVSLLSSCRMKLRPYISPAAHRSTPGMRRNATHEVVLARRSAYLMTGESRNAFEHHIPAVDAFRYSVTFRTQRA
jgi:alkylated DNA repair dioxygenase AlkB